MKITIRPDDLSAIVTDADEGNTNADGSTAVKTWSLRDGDQLGKHIVGMPTVKKAPAARSEDHPWSNLSAGDKTAAKDAAAQFADKQREILKNL